MIYRKHREEMKIHREINSEMKTVTMKIASLVEQMKEEATNEVQNNKTGSTSCVDRHQERT